MERTYAQAIMHSIYRRFDEFEHDEFERDFRSNGIRSSNVVIWIHRLGAEAAVESQRDNRGSRLSAASRPSLLILLLAFLAFSCGTRKNLEMTGAAAHPSGPAIEISAPLGLPPVPIPSDNRPTADSIALGRKLFYDVKLSRDDSLSCASCHNPALHFADGQRVAKGIGSQLGTRNTPSLLNAVYNIDQFWDGRADSLEQQAGSPIASAKEMNLPHEVCLTRLNADQAYREEFAKAFGPGVITMDKVVKAIAGFERTLLSGNSPFDRYQYGGDKTALSAAGIRGLAIFTDKSRGNCSTCHTVGEKFALFTDGKFHNIGAGMNSNGELTDQGRYTHTGSDADRGAFRTPSLRNVAMTSPYLHDGSLKTLKDVIDFYVGGGNSNPQLDREIKPLKLSAQDRSDLVIFLEALTGDMPTNAGHIKKD
jgi:cytochrome c peroxidase